MPRIVLTRSIDRILVPTLVLLGVLWMTPGTAEAAENRFGLGVHFWKTVDDLVDDIGDDSFADIEDDGFAVVLSYQRVPRGLFRFELDVEIYGEGYGGSDDTAVTPLAYILFGGDGLYVGAGVGVTFSDGLDGSVSDPFFAGRIGWDFALLPSLSLDINANYRTGSFSEIDSFDSDAVTLGAMVRFNL